MTDKLFCKLWEDALEQPNKEMYIAEYGYPDWFDEINPDPGEVVKILGDIHDVAYMSVRDMIKKSGMTQGAFATRFCVKKRTVESWVSSSKSGRECPAHERLMMAELLGFLDRGQC